MLKALRDKLKGLLDERAERQAALDAVLETVETEARSSLTEAEETEFRSITERLSEIDAERPELEARIAELEELDARASAADAARAELDNAPEGRTPIVRVGEEPGIYRTDVRASFFADALARREGRANGATLERLSAHEQRERLEARDVATSAFGGLVVPQYLVDEFADVLRNGRAYLNSVRRLPLPDEGMTIVIPRGQTGSSTAAQATQNSAVSETNVDFDNDLTVNVRTFAGQEDVSRQTLERGTPGIDRLVYADLVADYAETVDASAIADDGTSGTHVGLLNVTGENTVTYTDASPTVAEAWPKLANAVTQIANNRKRPALAWLMHGRRWGWFISALDSAGRPLVGINQDASVAMNILGMSRAAEFGEGQIVGTLQGLPVIIDNNIPTNLGSGTDEDRIFALRPSDQILWEEGNGMPRELRFDDVGSASLTVKLLVYGYSAFTGDRRPEGQTTIAGTGLIAPTF